MDRIVDVEKVSNEELDKILSLKAVQDRILLAMYAQRDHDRGYRQPPEVLRNQCNKCHWYGVECIKGSEYDEFSVFNRNCTRFSPFDLETWDSLEKKMINFRTQINAALERHNLTTADLIHAMHKIDRVNQQTVYGYLAGKSVLGVDKLEVMLQAMGDLGAIIEISTR